ncbi:HFR130Cp [Eremothecium sinecaudum]|uniref:Pre-mRNA-splicing factor CWC22 n=1 Tax=Eremothecium sinecaudum TaxID=45286 RepID=A0A0X8HV05_9SACH|nr:HFR130Cp [Eremothecium sinecaudum]AMD21985.1 HFR130Cp [Eremothecium sinecaudum]
MEESLQRQNWEQIRKHIKIVLSNLQCGNVVESFKQLFEVNVLRGKGILVVEIMKMQFKNDNSPAFAALVALFEEFIPFLGYTLSRECLLQFFECYQRGDFTGCYAASSLACELCNRDVLHEIGIFQLLFLLLEKPNRNSIDMVCYMLSVSGYHLLEVSKYVHNQIFDKLRNLVQDGNLSNVSSDQIQSLLSLRRTNYKGVRRSIELPEHKVQTHRVIVQLEPVVEKPAKDLDIVQLDSDFFDTEERFTVLREKVMLLYNVKNEEQEAVTDMTNSDDVRFKKQIYLILKNSLSGDEAAHKLLRLRSDGDQKKTIADIIVRSCSQEQTYTKFYGITSEKLCLSHRSWKTAFEVTFKDIYTTIESFESNQLRNMGKFWGHLLATDYLGFEVFNCVHMNEQETTPSGRVYLKFVFNELVEDLGIQELQNRLNEPYIQSYIKNLFPQEGAEKTVFAINYFTAIGLGDLTEKMRNALTGVNQEVTLKESNIPNQISRNEPMPARRGRSRSPRRDVPIQQSRNIANSPVRSLRRARSRTPPPRFRI